MVRAWLARGALGVALVAVAWPAAGAGAGPFEAERAAASARLAALRGRPEAIAPLTQLLALEDSLPAGAIEGALQEAAGPTSHPLVAAQATLQLARLYGDRGNDEKARATRGALGLLTRVQVVGPFGEGRAGHSQVFPPETETEGPTKGRTYRGKLGQVGWRGADDVVREGAILLDAMLRPDTQSTAYVVAFVQSPRDQDVAVRLGVPGPVKVWVDRTLVHAADAVHAAAMDQEAAPAHLRRGWNRILVKTTVTDLPWRLYLRVTDPAGRPLLLGDGAPPSTPKALPAGKAPHAPSGTSAPSRPAHTRLASLGLVETLEAALRKRAAAAPAGAAGAEAWLDLGRYLAWAEPGDHEAREAAAALETARARQPSVAVLRLLADVARDEDERRRALEAALAAANADASARALLLARLGDAARAQRRDTVALARWREALAVDPGCWPAALALADEEQGAGLVRVAVARVQALPAEVLAVPRVRRQWARLLEAAGRRREAREQLEVLLRDHRHDVDLLHDLATDARARGDGRELHVRLTEAAALRPDLTSLDLELARALEGEGAGAGAVEVLTALATRLPDDAIVQAQLGKLLHRQGQRDEALARLRIATALRPQDPELRRYAERVGREGDGDASEEDLARRYAADGRAIVTAAAPARADEPGDATVLLDRRVVRVHKNGLAQTFAQRLVAIRTDHGAEENKEFYVRYTPGSEDVEIRQARVYRRGAGGALEILEAADRDDQDLSEPWYGLYYDNRAEIVRFEGLRAGDVLEVQYVVEDVSAENQMADYFGDLETIAETVPKRVWEYTLVAPASRPIYANTPRVARLASNVSEQGDERVYTFSARDVPAIETEPAMPGLAEVAPYLHVSTYASWEEVGAWYWRLVEEQLLPDDDLRKAARGAVKGKQSEAERVRAVHALVVTGTRYVGLEFGIHGYKPYKVTQVLARRFGDCKDKASLMVALLREVGVEAELVLVRTRRGGNVEKQPASLAVFDHAIAYVPKLDLYLDGTAEFSGTRELPAQDQGVMVLRVGPKGTRLAETPVLPSAENRVDRKWSVDLATDGGATVREDLTIRGQAAADWREHYQTPGERAERYGRVWTGRYPGARLASIDMPALEDRDAPVTVRAVAEVPRLGVAAGGGLTLPLTVREADFSRTYARLSTRKQDLVIAYPWQHDEEIVYRLPPGWAVRGPSPARTVDGPFGSLRVEVTTAPGGTVRVHSFLDVTRARIAPADYPAFRAFLGEIDAAFAERLAVGPAGGGS
jgi:transglutaminase-like putative cysteine protease/tetratricopeptide (TPR) repeat protein